MKDLFLNVQKSKIHNLLNILNDNDKKKRLTQQKCQFCFYGQRIAGQAFSERQCFNCKDIIISQTTAVNVYCNCCAKKLNSCETCGGKLNPKILVVDKVK